MLISEKTAEIKEKERIKSMSNGIGLTLIGYFAVMLGWSFVYLRIASIFGLNIKQSLAFASDPMGENVLQAVISLLMVMVPTLIFCRIRLTKPSKVVSFSKPKGRFFPIFAAGLGFCFFASNATEIAGSFFEDIGISVPSPEIQDPEGLLGFLMSVIVTACVPALVEEFAVRGIILGVLREFGDGFAIICSAAVFGFMHASAEQIPFAALVGLALGLIVVKTGSLWFSIAIHAANNLICVLFSYAAEVFSSAVYFRIEIAANILLLFGFIWGVCDLSRRDDEFLSLDTANTKLKESKKLLAFFFSPAFICAAAASILIACFLR